MHRRPVIVAFAALVTILLFDAALLAQAPVVPAAGVSPWLRAVNVLTDAFTGARAVADCDCDRRADVRLR